MRLVGVVVLLVVLIGLPFVFPVWGQLLAVPWYLVGVLGFCLGSVLLSYSPGEMKASWDCFFATSGRILHGTVLLQPCMPLFQDRRWSRGVLFFLSDGWRSSVLQNHRWLKILAGPLPARFLV